MPSAPLAESSQSRKKTKTSSHNDKRRAGEQDKENSRSPFENRLEAENQDEDTSIAELPFPQTPAVRIPLEDLIGNTEDAFNCPPPLGTPRDHVIWHNGPASSDVSASARGTQKSRKRAHSSSPASSQLERSTHFDGQKEALDMNSIQKSLRTPNNDPTQELWNRYMSANMARQANGEFALPSFAHLQPSSPDTPSTTSKDSGLRRTASCGIEWPTSKPKRRKIDVGDSHSRTKDIFAASRREILAQNVPKTSRVGLLVEKIQESMNKRQRANDDPSSSSPLPGRHSQIPATQASPTRSPSRVIRGSKAGSSAPPAANSQQQSPLRKSQVSFSDFGDEDLDVDFFENVEKAISQEPVPSNPNAVEVDAKSKSQCNTDRPIDQRHSADNQVSDGPAKAQTTTANDNLDDSFGDDFDDDTFAEELQDLADKVDSQNQLSKISVVDGPAPLQPIMEVHNEVDDMDDAFDDDDDLWAQVADETAQGKTMIGSTSQVH